MKAITYCVLLFLELVASYPFPEDLLEAYQQRPIQYSSYPQSQNAQLISLPQLNPQYIQSRQLINEDALLHPIQYQSIPSSIKYNNVQLSANAPKPNIDYLLPQMVTPAQTQDQIKEQQQRVVAFNENQRALTNQETTVSQPFLNGKPFRRVDVQNTLPLSQKIPPPQPIVTQPLPVISTLQQFDNLPTSESVTQENEQSPRQISKDFFSLLKPLSNQVVTSHPAAQQILSHPQIKEALKNNKHKKRYLVIHPNGVVEHVDELESIQEKHPNYVLVNAGTIQHGSNSDPVLAQENSDKTPVSENLTAQSTIPTVYPSSTEAPNVSASAPPKSARKPTTVSLLTSAPPTTPHTLPQESTTKSPESSSEKQDTVDIPESTTPCANQSDCGNIYSSNTATNSTPEDIPSQNTYKQEEDKEINQLSVSTENSNAVTPQEVRTNKVPAKQTSYLKSSIEPSNGSGLTSSADTQPLIPNNFSQEKETSTPSTEKSNPPTADTKNDLPIPVDFQPKKDISVPSIKPASKSEETNANPAVLSSDETPNDSNTNILTITGDETPLTDSTADQSPIPVKFESKKDISDLTIEPTSESGTTSIGEHSNDSSTITVTNTASSQLPVPNNPQQEKEHSDPDSSGSENSDTAIIDIDDTTYDQPKPIEKLSEGEDSTDLDISKIKGKPTVWFRTTDLDMWEKLMGDLPYNVLYFFQIPPQPIVEKDSKVTVYPNGTIFEELTESTRQHEDDERTIKKIIKITNPDGETIMYEDS